MGLLLQKRDIPSDLYLVDPYVIASEEERALSAVLESESCYQDYLSRDALFERFRKAGLMERLAEHNRFIRREITRYVPTGTFSGRVVLFRAMKADPADSEALCRLREMRRPDNGFSGFTTRLSIVPIDSAHDRCMSDAQAIKIIAAEIIKEAIMEKKLAVSATEGSLETVMEFIAQELRANGFTAKAVTQTLIAAEEIFVNIVRYAYAEGGKAEIMFSMENESAVIAFADSGKPYNPLEKAPPDIALSADERPVGGLGIFLTRRLTDGMEYERAGGRNILRIKKNQDNA
jgi:anti-sigma regulatory factor (Ser/Thr protein kinase)